jgi:hypothetical protein
VAPDDVDAAREIIESMEKGEANRPDWTCPDCGLTISRNPLPDSPRLVPCDGRENAVPAPIGDLMAAIHGRKPNGESK